MWTVAYGTQQQEKERHETFEFLVWVCKLGKTAQLQTQCWLLLSGCTLILHICDFYLIVVSTATVQVTFTAGKGL
jgi:hypothetical protein